MQPGETLTLDIEKPAAGGRMLARHQGRVVLVGGAIPGEKVTVRVERVSRAVVFADTLDVLSPSDDRRRTEVERGCGGCALAHVEYARQLRLKQEIVQDAFTRIARAPLPDVPPVVPSPEAGYRMRARLHWRAGRLGFFREGSHEICDAGPTRQLADATVSWMQRAAETLRSRGLDGIAAIEVAENIDGDQRAAHLELHGGTEPKAYLALADGLTGLSAQRSDRADVVVLQGQPFIEDALSLSGEEGRVPVRLRRNVRAFFQSNRFLVDSLARHVLERVPPGRAIDLYAGVGLFGLSLAATGFPQVVLVEGDPVGAADLDANALAFGDRVRVERRSVEAAVVTSRLTALARESTVIVDPPRTGLSKEVLVGLTGPRPPRIVYVSCDPATLARDTRGLIDAGYALVDLTLFDMFPNTAHVEGVAVFDQDRDDVGRQGMGGRR
jgi:23S rRNA (uracil1939-C5)-methyltransferase